MGEVAHRTRSFYSRHCLYTASADLCRDQSAETADPKGRFLTGVKGRGSCRGPISGDSGGAGRRASVAGEWNWVCRQVVSALCPKRSVELVGAWLHACGAQMGSLHSSRACTPALWSR
jgi:hypothetical protein